MKKQHFALGRRLTQTRIQQIALAVAGVMVISGVAIVGTAYKKGSHAAVAAGTLYVSPTSGTYAPGSTISVDIRESSGTEPVIDVQAGLMYNPAQLRYAGVVDGTVFPGSSGMTDSTSRPGELLLFRGVSSSSSAPGGDNLVTTVQFQVLATSGTTNLSFNTGDSLIFGSVTNGNIMHTTIGATYTVQSPAPTISTVSPTSGSIDGGTAITITGGGFQSGATVTVGGTAATNVVVVSSTQITATAPSHAAGAVPVVVTNPDGGQITKANSFTYMAPAPAITSVSPTSGPSSGGTTVTITGNNFVNGSRVAVGTTVASSVTFLSATQLRFVTPPNASGSATTVGITVTNPDNQSGTKANAFSYIAPPSAPTITSFTPSLGFIDGGTSVTLTGTNFASGATVTFGTAVATSVTVVSASTIKLVTPTHTAGPVQVVVKNPDGSSGTASANFIFTIKGDSNGDGHVNGADYSVLVGHLGQNYPPADYNRDGVVSAADLAILLGAWTW